MSDRLEVRVSEECMGVGQCVAIAPAVFEHDVDGFSTVTTSPVPDGQRELVLKAVANCPTCAIEIVDGPAD